MESIQVAGRGIGPGHRCFIIAEAGVNHNGDVAKACRLVEVAAEAGADAIKFQTFDPEAVTFQDAPKAPYQVATTGSQGSQLEMLRGLVLPRSAYPELVRRAHDHGLLFLSTPFDEASADFLEELGVPAFKIPSGEVTNCPFVAHVARKGRPLLISTGMCTLSEVQQVVETVKENGAPPFALLHCVSAYPAEPSECNLKAMQTLREAFHVPVGWSDHTLGGSVAIAAVALGANLIEKHVTLDRGLPGPDHQASLEPKELQSLVQALRQAELAMGDGDKHPSPSERATAIAARKSLHLARSLPSGAVLQAADLVARRPGTGFPPAQLHSVVGRKLLVAVKAGELLEERHLG